MTNYFSILLFLFKVISITSTHIPIKYLDSFNFEKIKVNAGSPSYQYSISIDLNSQFSWFIEKEGAEYLSISEEQLKPLSSYHYKNSTFTGRQIKDLFHFEEDASHKITLVFYLIKKYETYYKGNPGCIGMTYHFNNIEQSIVHQYKLKGLINELSFAIINQKMKEYLYLGGLPEIYMENMQHTYCNVLSINGHWDCLIHEIIISQSIQNRSLSYKTNIDPTNDYTYFDVIDTLLFVPTDFFEFMIKNYYQNYLDNNMCGFSLYKEKRKLTCFNIYEGGNITFMIGDYAYSFQLTRFWKYYDEWCELEIVESPYGNHWVFGSGFMSFFNVKFDYDKKVIDFYSEKTPSMIIYKHEKIYQHKNIDRSSNKLSNSCLIISRVIIVNCVIIVIGLGILYMTRISMLKNILNFS